MHLVRAQLRSVAWRAFGVCAVLFYLFLSLAAVDHGLHECLHADAAHSDHQCVLTLVGHSQVTFEPLAAEPVVADDERVLVRSFETPVLPTSACHGLPPGRGPPAV